MATGLDYSAGVIPGSVIKNAGHDFVIRYVDDPAYASTKHIHPAEYADLVDSGVEVWLVFERGIDDISGAAPMGATNAKLARRGADWVGYPPGRRIFFACDEHLYGQNRIDLSMQYLDGASSVLGLSSVGSYGFPEEIAAAMAGRHASAFWQCGQPPAPVSGVHIWQRNDGAVHVGGIECDVNELLLPMAAKRGENVIELIPVEYLGGGNARAVVPVENAAGGSAAIGQCWVGCGITYGPIGTMPGAGFKAKCVFNSLRADGTLEKTDIAYLGNNQSRPMAYGASPQAKQVTIDISGLPPNAGPLGTQVTISLIATSV